MATGYLSFSVLVCNILFSIISSTLPFAHYIVYAFCDNRSRMTLHVVHTDLFDS